VDRPNYLSGALFKLKVSAYEKIHRVRRVVGFSMDNIYFDFNSAALRPVFKKDLAKLAQFMRTTPKAYIVISGYSCNIGPDKDKMLVSRGRAETVADYLINRLNIAPDRVISLWYGQINPAANNNTAKGRSLNRRVEIAVGGLE
jgi:OOP family OmpA-OmpF porin